MPVKTRERKLNAKQQAFVNYYSVSFNATEAYKQAGYKVKNDAVAGVNGANLLKNPSINAAVKKARAHVGRSTEITGDRIIRQFGRIGFRDIRKAFDHRGCLIPIKELDDEIAAAIGGIEIEELYVGYGANKVLAGHVKKIKLIEPTKALDSLAKIFGLYGDNQSTVTNIYNTVISMSEDERINRLRELGEQSRRRRALAVGANGEDRIRDIEQDVVDGTTAEAPTPEAIC